MDILKLEYPDPVDKLKTLMELTGKHGDKLEIGTAFLAAGSRIPDEGCSAYPNREISIILEGELEAFYGGVTHMLKAGDIITIPAHEEGFSIAKKDTRVIYIFFSAND